MRNLLFKNQKGITLIELLAAMIILGVVVMSFVSISNYSSLADHRSGMQTEAMRLAEGKLNTLRNEITPSDPIGSMNNTTVENGYTIKIEDYPLNSVTHPASNRIVTVNAIVLMHNGTNSEARLLTVTASWGD